jgi:hypothetical protein
LINGWCLRCTELTFPNAGQLFENFYSDDRCKKITNPGACSSTIAPPNPNPNPNPTPDTNNPNPNPNPNPTPNTGTGTTTATSGSFSQLISFSVAVIFSIFYIIL